MGGEGGGTPGTGGQGQPEAFRRVLDACHPETGEPLGVPGNPERRVAGFDLCFSAPKSVSVAWAPASPGLAASISRAHDRAVSQAIDALEADVLRGRRGAGGREIVETGGLVAAAFPHRSSRAGDPQIHTHLVTANLSPDSEGNWRAPYGGRLYSWAKTVGYLYQAALRAELAELGFGLGPVHKEPPSWRASRRRHSKRSLPGGPR